MFNALTGVFENTDDVYAFGALTRYDCGRIQDFDSDFFDEIDCGDLPDGCCVIFELGEL